jgi:hypothetical protein
VQRAAEEALRGIVAEEDMAWLGEWVIAQPLNPTGEAAHRLLVFLDEQLYGPFDAEAQDGG